MVRFCPECGAARMGEAPFCHACGRAFVSSPDGVRGEAAAPADARDSLIPSSSPETFASTPAQRRSKSHGRKGLIIALGAVSLAALATAAWWMQVPSVSETRSVSAEGSFDLALMPVSIGGRCGFVDAAGRVVIEPRFDFAGLFLQSGLAPVMVGARPPSPANQGRVDANDSRVLMAGAKWGLIDRQGRVAVNPQYDMIMPVARQNIFVVRRGQRFGLMDSAGTMLTGFRFDGVGPFDSAGRAAALEGGRMGLIDRRGNYVLRPLFEAVGGRVEGPGPHHIQDYFSHGVMPAKLNGKWGYVDQAGRWVINPQFTEARAFDANGLAAVNAETGSWGYIDRSGRFVIPPQYHFAYPFTGSGLARITLGEGDGYIDPAGVMRIPPRYRIGGDFGSGPNDWLAPVAVMIGGSSTYGLIDPSGAYRVAPQFANVSSFDENDLAVAVMSGAGERRGLIDRAGTFRVSPIYTRIQRVPGSRDYIIFRPQSGNAAASEFGIMDKEGRVLRIYGRPCQIGRETSTDLLTL